MCPPWRSENPSQKLKTIVIKKLLLHVLENLDFVNKSKLMSLQIMRLFDVVGLTHKSHLHQTAPTPKNNRDLLFIVHSDNFFNDPGYFNVSIILYDSSFSPWNII